MATIDAALTQALAAFDDRQDPPPLEEAVLLAGQAAQALPGWSGPRAMTTVDPMRTLAADAWTTPAPKAGASGSNAVGGARSSL